LKGGTVYNKTLWKPNSHESGATLAVEDDRDLQMESPAKILVVEDDPRFRSFLAAGLVEEYVVSAVSSGKEAMTFLSTQPVDVMVLDMIMAEGDGYSVLGWLSGLQNPPAVIVLTAMNRVEEAIKVMKLGAFDFLVKPCSLAKLRAAVGEAVSSKRVASTQPA
jgi:DNA-binding response OmpR family regulator